MHGTTVKIIRDDLNFLILWDKTFISVGRLSYIPWKTKRRRLYLRTQSVPRSKLFSSRL